MVDAPRWSSHLADWMSKRGGLNHILLTHRDDVADADGLTILSFGQAQEKARAWFTAKALADSGHEAPLAPHTVSDALDDYERDYLRRGGKAADRLQHSINAHIRPAFGPIELDKLSRAKIESWLEKLANTPPRLRVRSYRAPPLRHTGRERLGP